MFVMMWMLQNIFIFFSVILICLSYCNFTFAAPVGIAEALKINDHLCIMIVLLQSNVSSENPNIITTTEDEGNPRKRVKRQSGGKFAESAKMSQTKLMQLYMQMFKNMVAGKNIGGSHPMHPDAVKPIVKLFKQRIITFFFPEVGEQKV